MKRNFLVIVTILLFVSWISSCSRKNSNEVSGNEDSLYSHSLEKIIALMKASEMWQAPDTSSIPIDKNGDMIRFGRSLIANTSAYLGPSGSISHISNGMNCQNCHLDAGTKPFGNNYSAVASTYPKFRARSGGVESIEKRVNDCIERSLNGKALDSNSYEMRSIVSYIKWLGTGVPKGKSPNGVGLVEVPYLDRPADPAKGKIVFEKQCITCHGADGTGKLNPNGISYQYPPLWGPHSYNIGAGLFRLSRFAGYIKANMPYLTSSYLKPVLTDEEAWDIAAYVNSMQRPDRDLHKDWPDISKKPIDHPFGPYADAFSEAQHKYGPFTAIAAAKKKK